MDPVEASVPNTTPPLPPPPPPPPPLTCATADLGVWAWSTSEPLLEAADPTDTAGVPFFDPAAALTSFAPVGLPHRDIPIGTDRAYVGTASLSEVPVNLSLELQTDDGVEIWVNGSFVGQWGGAWQEEGCVNEQAECLVTTTVGPVDVTALLVVGDNLIAARVTNPVLNAWFEVAPRCID